MKVHMLIDAVQSVAKFVRMTEAAKPLHDKNFLMHLDVPEYSLLVFDKAYNYYQQFAEWTAKNIWFVTRQKSNAVYQVLETIKKIELPKNEFGVWKEELIEVTYGKKTDQQKLQLRRICYRDEQRREYVFISNNMEITAEEIALIDRKRWGIELLFTMGLIPCQLAAALSALKGRELFVLENSWFRGFGRRFSGEYPVNSAAGIVRK